MKPPLQKRADNTASRAVAAASVLSVDADEVGDVVVALHAAYQA